MEKTLFERILQTNISFSPHDDWTYNYIYIYIYTYMLKKTPSILNDCILNRTSIGHREQEWTLCHQVQELTMGHQESEWTMGLQE